MYMAEMRTVTTLFVKLDSYSPEKHKNLLSLQVPQRSFFCCCYSKAYLVPTGACRSTRPGLNRRPKIEN